MTWENIIINWALVVETLRGPEVRLSSLVILWVLAALIVFLAKR